MEFFIGGFLIYPWIKIVFFNTFFVVIALIIGGIAMIADDSIEFVKKDIHKYSKGDVQIVAGGITYPGAAILSSLGYIFSSINLLTLSIKSATFGDNSGNI